MTCRSTFILHRFLLIPAAESGFDFSSRWARNFIVGEQAPECATNVSVKADEFSLTEKQRTYYFSQIDTINVVPVDLNAILFRYEMNMSMFAKVLLAKSETATIGKEQ